MCQGIVLIPNGVFEEEEEEEVHLNTNIQAVLCNTDSIILFS